MNELLVVIDMQNDFITGALGNEECVAVVPKVVERIKKAAEDGVDIMFTLDTHHDDYLETQEGRNLPVKHCIKDSDGWYLDPMVESALCQNVSEEVLTCYELYRCDNCIEKNTFGSTELGDIVIGSYDKITLIGVCTDICVISNAMIIKAFEPEAEVIVDSACCAGVTPESHKNALEAMKACQITVI